MKSRSSNITPWSNIILQTAKKAASSITTCPVFVGLLLGAVDITTNLVGKNTFSIWGSHQPYSTLGSLHLRTQSSHQIFILSAGLHSFSLHRWKIYRNLQSSFLHFAKNFGFTFFTLKKPKSTVFLKTRLKPPILNKIWIFQVFKPIYYGFN